MLTCKSCAFRYELAFFVCKLERRLIRETSLVSLMGNGFRNVRSARIFRYGRPNAPETAKQREKNKTRGDERYARNIIALPPNSFMMHVKLLVKLAS